MQTIRAAGLERAFALEWKPPPEGHRPGHGAGHLGLFMGSGALRFRVAALMADVARRSR